MEYFKELENTPQHEHYVIPGLTRNPWRNELRQYQRGERRQ